MAWHFWPALPAEDSLWVPETPPEPFLRYLASVGLQPPRFLPDPAPRESPAAAKGARLIPKEAGHFFPFGWSAEAYARNAGYESPSSAPDPAVVQRVNSRAFSALLERENFGPDACPAVFCRTREELKKWAEGASPGRYVAKGNHGLAGIGQLRFEIPAFSEDSPPIPSPGPSGSPAGPLNGPSRSSRNYPREHPGFASLERLRARMDGVVLEREQEVLREFGVLFRLGRNGEMSPLRVHRLLCEMDGKYSGSLAMPEGVPDPEHGIWRESVKNISMKISSLLCSEGYFGPVSVDMYVWNDGGRARLRPVVDLNARCSMAWPVHGLAQCFQGKTVLVSQVASSGMDLPATYGEMLARGAGARFDLIRRRGFILLTPLLSLSRHSLAFIGNDAADAMALRARTLGTFARRGITSDRLAMYRHSRAHGLG